MGTIEYEIDKIFANAFGYIAFPYIKPGQEPISPMKADAFPIEKAPGYGNGKDILGRPFYSQVKINDIWLPNEPLLTVSGSKTIVKTAVAGRAGTVKELISANDYNLKIQGIIINSNGSGYPEEDVMRLHELFKIGKTVKIESRLLDIIGVNTFVIESFSLPHVQGRINIQPYELNCVSDDEFDVFFNE